MKESAVLQWLFCIILVKEVKLILANSILSSEPTICTTANAGHCECADESQGFQTYTFMLGGSQRCFTVFQPLSRSSESLPVIFEPNCYAKDALQGIDMVRNISNGNRAANRYGYSRIGVSTPNGNWMFGNDNIINDDKPMPCSDHDSKDIQYIRTIFNFLESQPEKFDMSKVFTQGFSQNSMFAAYIGYCFSDNVIGIWQGGSGMALTGQPPNLPGNTISNFCSIMGNSITIKKQKKSININFQAARDKSQHLTLQTVTIVINVFKNIFAMNVNIGQSILVILKKDQWLNVS